MLNDWKANIRARAEAMEKDGWRVFWCPDFDACLRCSWLSCSTCEEGGPFLALRGSGPHSGPVVPSE